MGGVVYLLCAATSLACGGLLLRGFKKTRVKLLLWSGLCFMCLAAQNALLYVDVIVYPAEDLSVLREIPAVVGLLLLLYGMVWESN
jgi:hypothetical protein